MNHGFASAVGTLVHRPQPTSAAAAAINDWRGRSAASWLPTSFPPDSARASPSAQASPSAAPMASHATAATAIVRVGLTMQSEAAYANGTVKTNASLSGDRGGAEGIGNQQDG